MTWCCVAPRKPFVANTTWAGCSVGAYRSTVVATPSTVTVAMPRSGPFVETHTTSEFTLNTTLLSLALAPTAVVE